MRTLTKPGLQKGQISLSTAYSCQRRRLVRLRLQASPQDRCRDQRDDEPNRERLDERQRCVQERVLVQLLVLGHLLQPRLKGCRTRARGPELLNQMRAIFVPEIRQEVVV